jgi:hypothetical protein
MKRNWTLPEVLEQRVVRSGNLVALLEDAVLRQDVRWITDQIAGRKSEV